MTVKLLIVSASEYADEASMWLEEYIESRPQLHEEIKVIGYCDDEAPIGKKLRLGKVLGSTDKAYNATHFIVLIGNPKVREAMYKRFKAMGLVPLSCVSPSAWYDDDLRCGEMVFVSRGDLLTSHVVIGDGCLLNVNVTIGHRVVLGRFCTVNPNVNIMGDVRVGNYVYFGVGALVRDKVSIGDRAIIGMGSVVVKDVPPCVTVVGNPAKPMRQGYG